MLSENSVFRFILTNLYSGVILLLTYCFSIVVSALPVNPKLGSGTTYQHCSDIPDSNISSTCNRFITNYDKSRQYQSFLVVDDSAPLNDQISTITTDTLIIMPPGDYLVTEEILQENNLGFAGMTERDQKTRILLSPQSSPEMESLLSISTSTNNLSTQFNGVDFHISGDSSNVSISSVIRTRGEGSISDFVFDYSNITTDLQGHNLERLVDLADVRDSVSVNGSSVDLNHVNDSAFYFNCNALIHHEMCNTGAYFSNNVSSGVSLASTITIENFPYLEIADNLLALPNTSEDNDTKASIRLLFSEVIIQVSGRISSNTIQKGESNGLAVVIDNPDPDAGESFGYIVFQGNSFGSEKVFLNTHLLPNMRITFLKPTTVTENVLSSAVPHSNSHANDRIIAGAVLGTIGVAIYLDQIVSGVICYNLYSQLSSVPVWVSILSVGGCYIAVGIKVIKGSRSDSQHTPLIIGKKR